MNVLSLFDGISCGRIALERAGVHVDNYFSSEIDKTSIKISLENYKDIQQVGDARVINVPDSISIDLLIGGSPCQSFSFAGKRNGMSTKCKIEITSLEQYLELKSQNFEFEGQSYLFWEYVRLLKQATPKYFLLENVNVSKKWESVISETLGVRPVKINSSLVSAQNRELLYWTNIPFMLPADKMVFLKDLIGEYDGIWVYPRGFNKGGVQSYKGKSPTITISSWEHNFFIQRLDGKRESFTPEICEQLQTLPIGYTKSTSKSKRIKAIGNGWTVDVIAHIFKGLHASDV